MYSLHMLQDVVRHLASSRQREVYAKQFPVVTDIFFLREVPAIQSMEFMYVEDSSLRRAALWSTSTRVQ
jgi:hypothetical protein